MPRVAPARPAAPPPRPARAAPPTPTRANTRLLINYGRRCVIAPRRWTALAASGDTPPPPPPSPTFDLPIDPVLPSIVDALVNHHACILEAPPGAGKTTAVPLALAAANLSVLVVEPRRLAAKSAARRMAAMLGERPGASVGYRVRGDARVSKATRVLVVTPGIALSAVASKRLGYACLMLDEAHERGAEADVLFALAAAAVNKGGGASPPPFRVVVASATLGDGLAAKAAGLLGPSTPIITAPAAQAFPVRTVFAGAPAPGTRELATAAVAATRSALAAHPGDALVFVPGVADIRAVARGLEAAAVDADVFPLHGGLAAAAQDAVLAPPRDLARRRRVVIATNIAESSVTVPGVRIVVDSGLARRPRGDPATLLDKLHTLPTSIASADQRRGRAGRLGPGLCVRLWSEAAHAARPAATAPELADGDVGPTALTLAAAGWGASWRELPWLDAPPEAGMEGAWRLLRRLGLVQGDGVTPAGAAAAAVGAHPRLARMLLMASAERNTLDLGAVLAALVSARDPVRGGRAPTADVGARVAALAGAASPVLGMLDARAAQDVLDTALLLKRQVERARKRDEEAGSDDDNDDDPPPPRAAAARAALATAAASQLAADPALAGTLLAAAYPDRLATRRARGNAGRAVAYVLQGDDGGSTTSVRLASPDDPLADAPLLVVPALVTPRAAERAPLAVLAARVDESRVIVEDDATPTTVEWVPSAKRAIVKGGAPTQAAVACALAAAIEKGGLACVGEPAAGRAWRARVRFAAATAEGAAAGAWPDLSDAGVAAAADRWVSDAVAAAALNAGGLAALDWVEAVYGRLVTDQQRKIVEAVAPAATAVGGLTARLEYGPLTPPPPITCPPSFQHAPPYAVVSLDEAARLQLTGGVAGAAAIVLTLGARTVAVAPTFDAAWADWDRVRAAAARIAGGKKGKEWGKKGRPVG